MDPFDAADKITKSLIKWKVWLKNKIQTRNPQNNM
jgi:hypothetical protein